MLRTAAETNSIKQHNCMQHISNITIELNNMNYTNTLRKSW